MCVRDPAVLNAGHPVIKFFRDRTDIFLIVFINLIMMNDLTDWSYYHRGAAGPDFSKSFQFIFWKLGRRSTEISKSSAICISDLFVMLGRIEGESGVTYLAS